jgi:hypothetical protein
MILDRRISQYGKVTSAPVGCAPATALPGPPASQTVVLRTSIR